MPTVLEKVAFQKIPDHPTEAALFFDDLSPCEQIEYRGYLSQKRRFDFIAGRIACKKAVAQLILSSSAASDPLADIVLNPSRGLAPGLRSIPVSTIPASHIKISLSHSGEWACAMACFVNNPLDAVGIDLEKIEVHGTPVRFNDELISMAFGPYEQIWIRLEPWRFFQFWTAKEALLKALGVGFTIDLLEINLIPKNNLHSLCAYFRQTQFVIHSNRNETYFWSWCRISQGEIPMSFLLQNPPPSC